MHSRNTIQMEKYDIDFISKKLEELITIYATMVFHLHFRSNLQNVVLAIQ